MCRTIDSERDGLSSGEYHGTHCTGVESLLNLWRERERERRDISEIEGQRVPVGRLTERNWWEIVRFEQK